MAVGERIREEREKRGWTQGDLSKHSGTNRDTISGVESGRHRPRPSTLRKLAGAFGLEVRDLFEEATPRPKAVSAGPRATTRVMSREEVLVQIAYEDDMQGVRELVQDLAEQLKIGEYLGDARLVDSYREWQHAAHAMLDEVRSRRPQNYADKRAQHRLMALITALDRVPADVDEMQELLAVAG